MHLTEEGLLQYLEEVDSSEHVWELNVLIDRYMSILNAAFNQRVHPSLISSHQIRQIHFLLQQEANAKNLKLPVDHDLQLLQFPASLYLDQNQFDYTLVLHIPLVPKEAKPLQQYALMPSPFIISLSHRLVGRIVYNQDIVVSDDRSHFALIESKEMDRCLHLGTTAFCPHLLLRSDFSEHCLSRLYQNQLANLTLFCKIFVRKAPWHIMQRDKQWFGFSEKPIHYQVTCVNGTRQHYVLQGFSQIFLEPLCKAVATQFTLFAPPSLTDSALSVTHDFSFEEVYHQDLHELLNNTDIISDQEKLITDIEQEVQSEKQQIQSDMQSAYASKINHSLIATTATIACILVILIASILYCMIRTKRLQKAIPN